MSEQTFAAWLAEKYWTEPTPVGDLAREFGDVLADAGGERAGLRQSVQYYVGPESWALDAFDRAYDEYDPPPPPPCHPFVAWLREHHGHEDDTPLGNFARELEAADLPLSADRDELRALLDYEDEDKYEYALACLDVAWDRYEPRCSWTGCMEPADNDSSVCAAHGLL